MTPSEIVQYAVSASSAVICLYVKSELSKQRSEINEAIGKLRIEMIERDNATRWWVSKNFRPWHQGQDCNVE